MREDGVQFSASRKIMRQKYIIGIDEVGRGPLAGPVTVAVAAIPNNLKFLKLRDSKKLSAKQREKWFKFVKENGKIYYAIASVSPKIIDRINISKAANLAATRALKKLLVKQKIPSAKTQIFLDGGLHAKIQNTRYKIQTIVRGDEKIPAIALASIVAKVSRDRRMKKLHRKFPKYDFINNVGYGTKKHIRALKKHGLRDIHRKTFAKKFLTK